MAVRSGSGRSICGARGCDARVGERVRGDQAMAAQRSRQPLDEGGKHGSVRPVQARSWVGAAQDGDLVAQHEELDVLGGGRSSYQ